MMSEMLALEQVTCDFPGVRALDRVSLEFQSGEVHALAGENGAGKSTIIRILSGLVRPTSGHIRIGDRTYTHLRHAHRLGIRVVPQEPALVPDLSVAENVLLGRMPRRRSGTVDWRATNRRARELLLLAGMEQLNPDEPAHALSTSHMQMVQVARALADGGSAFLFDEPSSSLCPSEFSKLAALILRLRDEGKLVIYVSHRMAEIFALCDRVSVLRDGQGMGTLRPRTASQDDVIRLMIGRDVAPTSGKRNRPGGVALRVPLPGGSVLELRQGEIVGLGGLVGAGRTQLLKGIFFQHSRDDSGIALVPEDRQQTGLALDLTVADNLALTNLRMLSRFGMVDPRRKHGFASEWIGRFGIRCNGPQQCARTLSGGNQQKIVLAKWLARRPRVLLLDEPTRGIDIAAKSEIHRILMELAEQGTAILMASSEMPELLALSDRILVMRAGAVTAELGPNQMSEQAILSLATPAYAG